MPDLARAALRLELSDREIGCPKKGVLAIARCVELQQELACTCDVYRAYVAQHGVPQIPPPEPDEDEQEDLDERRAGTRGERLRGRSAAQDRAIAELRKLTAAPVEIREPPPGEFDRWQRAAGSGQRAAGSGQRAAGSGQRAAGEATAPSTPPVERATRRALLAERVKQQAPVVEKPPAEEETTMVKQAQKPGREGTAKLFAAMEAEPERQFSIAEMVEIRGGTVEQLNALLPRMRRGGKIGKADRGLYQWATGVTPANGAGPTRKARKGNPARAYEASGAVLDVVRKLQWALLGAAAGFLSHDALRAIANGDDVRKVLG